MSKAKPLDGKSIIEEAKNKVKQNQTNEKETNNMKTISITIVSTIVAIAILGAIFYYGFKFGVSYENDQQQKVTQQAKSLVTSVAPLK